MKNINSSKGFTLVEVLIAAVILFSALAIAGELFSASSLAATKAAKTAQYYQQATVAISTIKSDIRQRYNPQTKQPMEGHVLINGVQFNWRAEVQDIFARPQGIDEVEPPTPRFAYYQVRVESPVNLREFDFSVVAW